MLLPCILNQISFILVYLLQVEHLLSLLRLVLSLENMKKINNFFPFILLLCLIPALWGIFHAGFFVSDDAHWMVIRLSAFYEALASGQLPVRFLPRLNEGFGYPVADFLYPLFLYVGSFLHLLRIPFVLVV